MSVQMASRARGRRAAGGPRHHRRGRSQERRARPLRRAVLGARQPLSAPGRPARGRLDRERAAALPVARLRLLPARRHVARLRRRGDDLPARDPRRRGVRRRRRTSTHVATVTDLMAETMVNWGVEHVFGMVGHSNLGLADALRRQEEAGQAHLHRHPPRGRGGVRRVRLRQAHRPPRGLPHDRRPRRHQPAHRAVGREGRPRAGPRAHRPGRHAGARPGRVPGGRPRGRVRLRRRVEPARAARLQPGRADEPRVQARAAAPRRRAPDLPRRGPDAAGARGRGGGRPDRPRVAVDDLPARGVDRGRPAAPARFEAAGDHRRPRRPLPHARGDRARRAARRAGDHDVQGQGPDRRRPPAGGGRARAQRHAGGELGDERGRPAARARRVVLQPHRHLHRPPDHPGRLRPDAAREVPPRRRARVGRGRRRGRPPARASCPTGSRPTTRPPSSPSAGRSGGRRRPAAPPTTAAPASTPPRCSRRWSARSPTTP